MLTAWLVGTRKRRPSSGGGRRGCRQARPKPVERLDVGYDEPSQGDCKDTAR